MSLVRQIAEDVCSWTPEEWEFFNAPPAILKFDQQVSDQIRGVVLEFIGWGGQGVDGSLFIELENDPRIFGAKRLAFTTLGSRRDVAEDVLYRLVLQEVRKGVLSSTCRLAPGFYPRSSETALNTIMIHNRRLRSQVEQLQGTDS